MTVKLLALTHKVTGVQMALVLDDLEQDYERAFGMSAEIYNNIYKAIAETHPELLDEFDKCRDKPKIVAFMNKHFPLDPKQVERTDWADQLMTKAPDMIKGFNYD